MKDSVKKLFEEPVDLPKEIIPVSLAERLHKVHAGIDSLDTAWELVNSLFMCIRQKLMDEGQCKLGCLGLLYIKRSRPYEKLNNDGTVSDVDYKQILHFTTSKRMRRYLGVEPCKNVLRKSPQKPI